MNLLITEYNFSANRFVAAVTFKQNFFNRYLKHFLKYFKLARKKKKKMKINLSFYSLVLTVKEIFQIFKDEKEKQWFYQNYL